MTTILEEPYMMLRKTKPGEVLRGNERYEGYCKDLTEAITKLTGIKFKIKPVSDGKYGSPDSRTPGGGGMVSGGNKMMRLSASSCQGWWGSWSGERRR